MTLRRIAVASIKIYKLQCLGGPKSSWLWTNELHKTNIEGVCNAPIQSHAASIQARNCPHSLYTMHVLLEEFRRPRESWKQTCHKFCHCRKTCLAQVMEDIVLIYEDAGPGSSDCKTTYNLRL